MKKKNLITITRHPSVSCYVEEGSRSGMLQSVFVVDLASGGMRSRELSGLSYGSFYVNYSRKSREEQDMWVRRLWAIREFARANMV